MGGGNNVAGGNNGSSLISEVSISKDESERVRESYKKKVEREGGNGWMGSGEEEG